MHLLYLTPASIAYLTQFILSAEFLRQTSNIRRSMDYGDHNA